MENSQDLRTSALEAMRTEIPDSLLQEPLEYIFADHFRQRAMCMLLDEIADNESIDIEAVSAALTFLTSQFRPHIADEEAGLFPLLLERAEPEDEFDAVLKQLTEEHVSDGQDAKSIIPVLERLLLPKGEGPVGPDVADLLKRFAANERQHLIVENSIVLPLARARLTDEDLKNLASSMAIRRGVSLDD